jgi:hypothetical protein
MEKRVTKEELLAKAQRPARDAMRMHPYYRGKVQVVLTLSQVWDSGGVSRKWKVDIYSNILKNQGGRREGRVRSVGEREQRRPVC